MSRYNSVGTRRNEQDAILRRMHIYDEYPFVCISDEALAILQSASQSVSPSIQKSIPVVLKALECYLAVTGKKMEATTTGRIRLGEVRNGFLAAVYSSRFLAATLVKRHQYANIWSQIANAVSADFGLAGFPHLPEVGRHTNIKKNQKGELVNTKLLLDVPLQLTDQEAMEILSNTLDTEISVIEKWAESRAADIWANRERRDLAARSGKPRIYDTEHGKFIGARDLTSRSNPQWFENSAATFAHAGFRPSAGEPFERGLYPYPLSDLAYQLGLPTTGSLVPHLAILVANHTELTPSLLEKLELHDRAGHDCLIQQIGGESIFSGVKLRRGADLAEQTVVFNEKTIAIVQQVIELTRPLREYLKSVGDSAWRLLFLSCGRGFAYPRALKISELTSSALRLEHTASQMSQICGLSIQVAELTARRFSLPRLRASVAVSAYIKKPDIGTLSRSLGHANVDAKLLRSYLPEALLDFFQERWIRLFQCALLCEALKDSKWRLPATGFRSEAELDEFMMNHRLKLKPAATQPYGKRLPSLTITHNFSC